MSSATNGDTVSVHYIATLDDGTEFSNSRIQQEKPTVFQLGSGKVIAGFNNGILGMKVGETKTVEILPEQAYGSRDPEAIKTVKKRSFPDDVRPTLHAVVQGKTAEGNHIKAVVTAIQDDDVILDFNHPLAGKTLHFEIELIDIIPRK